MEQMIRSLSGRTWRELLRDQRGNVLMVYGFAVIPLTFSVGMGIDYARAMRAQTKLNAAADAAALNSVSQTMMLQSTESACDSARALFEAQSADTPGVAITSVTYSVKKADGTEIGCQNITDNAPPADKRYFTVSYRARSTNSFGGILGWADLPISGGSGTYASVAPDIDFYIALDTSPSMALPTTQWGIDRLQDKVGCTFACHSNKIEGNVQNPGTTGHMDSLIVANPDFAINYINGTKSCLIKTQNPCQTANQIYTIGDSGHYIFADKAFSSVTYQNWPSSTTNVTCRVNNKDKCVRNPDGTLADSYWYALNQSIPLRVTDERSAVKDLMDIAEAWSIENKADYRAALFTFDHATNLKRISSLTDNLVGSGGVKEKADSVDLVTVNDRAGGGRPPNGTSGADYLFTSFKSILDTFSTGSLTIPNPGNGTNAPGDTPQAFVFLVTDGMSDENIGSGRTRAAMQQAQINQCNALKNRRIKIAVLYTEYTWESVEDDEPGQRAIVEKSIKGLDGKKRIEQALTECASPGLMYTVRTDESITNALQALFSKALASARIIQ